VLTEGEEEEEEEDNQNEVFMRKIKDQGERRAW
jgi:hypothetical protein